MATTGLHQEDACLVCLEHVKLESRYFMPCRCRINVCDVCIERVDECLYHRKPDGGGLRTFRRAQLAHLAAYQRLVSATRVRDNMLIDMNETLVQQMQELSRKFCGMRTCVVVTSLCCCCVVVLKDAAHFLYQNHGLSYTMSVTMLVVNGVLFMSCSKVSWATVRNAIMWMFFAVLVVLYAYSVYYKIE